MHCRSYEWHNCTQAYHETREDIAVVLRAERLCIGVERLEEFLEATQARQSVERDVLRRGRERHFGVDGKLANLRRVIQVTIFNRMMRL